MKTNLVDDAAVIAKEIYDHLSADNRRAASDALMVGAERLGKKTPDRVRRRKAGNRLCSVPSKKLEKA